MDDFEYKHWVEGLKEFDWQNELVAMAIMCAFTKPTSWLDVGCGTGAMVKVARQVGVAAFGVDQIAEDGDWFKRADLTKPFDYSNTFELVSSIEMVEHLPEQFEGVISDTLVRHVAPGGRLVLSAARPGQQGFNHFNCQPQKYWRDRMESRGLTYSIADTTRLSEILKWTYTALNHLRDNVQVFKR